MGPSIRNEGAGTTDRGQTGLDFLVGMSVFLLAVGFVFLFLPTMFDPFVGSGTSNALVADRSAAHLTENVLVDPEKPGDLNETKAAAFFDACDEEGINELLGVGLQRVNVTLEHAGSVVDSCGPAYTERDSVTASQRILSDSENDLLRLYVRVW